MRTLKVILAVVVVFIFGPSETVQPAYAGGVSGVASEWTQLLNWAELTEANSTQLQYLENSFESIQHELTQIQNQETMIGHAEKQTNSLLNVQNQQVFKDAMGDMASLANIIQVGNGLAYSMANMDTEFSNRYKGFGYTTTANYPAQYHAWLQTSLDTTHGALNAVGLQGQQLGSDTQLLQQLQSQSTTTSGLLQAVQVGNQLAAQEVLELQKLRQLMMADITSKQAFQAQQLNESMAASDLNKNFFAAPTTPANTDTRTFSAVPNY